MKMSLRDLAKHVGISHTAIARVETDHPKATIRTAEVLEQYFEAQRIFFGPSNGVSINGNAFSEGRWLTLAALKIATDHGCGTRELLAAADTAKAEIADLKRQSSDG